MTMIFPKKREKQLITYHYLRLVFFYLPGRCYTQSSSKSSRCSIPRPHLDCVIGQKSVGIWNNNIKVSSTNLCIYIYIHSLTIPIRFPNRKLPCLLLGSSTHPLPTDRPSRPFRPNKILQGSLQICWDNIYKNGFLSTTFFDQKPFFPLEIQILKIGHHQEVRIQSIHHIPRTSQPSRSSKAFCPRSLSSYSNSSTSR